MNGFSKPPHLSSESTLGVVAPASPVDRERFLRGVKELERLGYKASYSDDLFAAEKYFAGSHERRIQEFQRALADPNTKAVFAARGGYGSGYLTGKLTKGNLQPKIVLGASDLTIVHLHLLKHFGWVTFYGPMVAQEFARGPEAYDEASLRASLEGKSNWVAYEGGTVLRQGTAEGILLGGCLSLIVATLGTPDEPDTRGALLLVEDINAKPYQVDRMLLQLIRAGKLDEVRGIVFGQMPGCVQDSDQNLDQGYELTEVIADVLGDFKGPIAYGVPFGHARAGTLTLPLGVRARLEATRTSRLTVLEAATV